jgi:hypothetical protein
MLTILASVVAFAAQPVVVEVPCELNGDSLSGRDVHVESRGDDGIVVYAGSGEGMVLLEKAGEGFPEPVSWIRWRGGSPSTPARCEVLGPDTLVVSGEVTREDGTPFASSFVGGAIVPAATLSGCPGAYEAMLLDGSFRFSVPAALGCELVVRAPGHDTRTVTVDGAPLSVALRANGAPAPVVVAAAPSPAPQAPPRMSGNATELSQIASSVGGVQVSPAHLAAALEQLKASGQAPAGLSLDDIDLQGLDIGRLMQELGGASGGLGGLGDLGGLLQGLGGGAGLEALLQLPAGTPELDQLEQAVGKVKQAL